jgi:hypothetical protein
MLCFLIKYLKALNAKEECENNCACLEQKRNFVQEFRYDIVFYDRWGKGPAS